MKIRPTTDRSPPSCRRETRSRTGEFNMRAKNHSSVILRPWLDQCDQVMESPLCRYWLWGVWQRPKRLALPVTPPSPTGWIVWPDVTITVKCVCDYHTSQMRRILTPLVKVSRGLEKPSILKFNMQLSFTVLSFSARTVSGWVFKCTNKWISDMFWALDAGQVYLHLRLEPTRKWYASNLFEWESAAWGNYPVPIVRSCWHLRWTNAFIICAAGVLSIWHAYFSTVSYSALEVVWYHDVASVGIYFKFAKRTI